MVLKHQNWSPTRQSLGNFGCGLHSQSLENGTTGKYKLNTTQTKQTMQNYPGSVTSYDTWPGNEITTLLHPHVAMPKPI